MPQDPIDLEEVSSLFGSDLREQLKNGSRKEVSSKLMRSAAACKFLGDHTEQADLIHRCWRVRREAAIFVVLTRSW